MIKVPCTTCGVLILESTAQKNGGLCAPCKSGIRESLEKSKQWYKEHRERERSDPVRILWKELVSRMYKSEDGFSGLSEAERLYFAVGLLDGEVYNGGFDQYFHNSSAEFYYEALAGLKAMGAIESLKILQRAKQVMFDFRDVPRHTSQRRQLLRKVASDSRTKRLSQLDEEYWKDPDTLYLRVEDFVRKRGLVG